MPMDAEVVHLLNGGARTEINLLWVSRNGEVVTSDYGQVCYEDCDRPKDSPTKTQDKYWSSDDFELKERLDTIDSARKITVFEL